MKKKISLYLKSWTLITILLFITSNALFAQGNSNNNGQGKLWEKNQTTGNIYNTSLNNYVGIGTNNPLFPMDVKGKIHSDSLAVDYYINADSMHVRSLRVGDHSLWIAGSITPSGPTDNILSNNGNVCFGKYPFMFSNVKIGIGTSTPNYKLSLFDRNYLFGGPAPAVYESFNNLGSGISPGTGNLSTDGFLVGINSNGDAQLIQQEDNLPISFHTNMGGATGERMRIINNEIFTNNFMRMTITEDINNLNYASVPGALGPVLGTPELLVVGSEQDLNNWPADPPNNCVIAEFRSREANLSSAAIKLRGARNQFQGPSTFILFSNWDDAGDGGTPMEFTEAAIATGMITTNPQTQNGYFQIFTNDGTNVNPNPFPATSKFFIDDVGHTGVGTIFNRVALNDFDLPRTRLEVYEHGRDPQFRITYQYDDDGNVSTGINNIYTDFQTTANGDLFIHPFNETQPTVPERDRFVGINTNLPGNTLEINGQETTIGAGPTFSGLRFHDMNSSATPTITTNKVLSVDNNGDVILVNTGGGTSSGFGAACTSSTPFDLSEDWRVGLNDYNLFFDGNQGGSNVNNIIIGNDCTYPAKGKLDVMQQSGDVGTVGIFVKNKDASTPWAPPIQTPSIGVKSVVANPTNFPNQSFQVAGWFEAHPIHTIFNPVSQVRQYAIFVPMIVGAATPIPSGTVDIGYNYSNDVPDLLLDVNGVGRFLGWTTPSDSILKTDVQSYNLGLEAIKQMNPKTYYYNGLGSFDTTQQYIGIIAQDLAQISPMFVDTSYQRLDTMDTQLTPILNIKQDAILYSSVNAIKQLDSIVTVIKTLPVAPFLILPLNGDTGLSIKSTELVWSSVDNVTGYQVQIALDSTFLNIVNSQNTFDTTLFGGVRYCDTVCYWHVRAMNQNGYGQWSETWHFKTAYCGGGNPIIKLDTLTEVAYRSASDVRYKTNIGEIDNPLEKILQLNGVSYDWKYNDFPDINFDTTRQIGLIAQDVEPVLPEVVHTDSNGYYSLDYSRIVPVLIEAIKEQQTQMDSMQQVINSIVTQLASCCDTTMNNKIGVNTETGNSINVEIVSKGAILYQNTPNPFGEGTAIRYFIPDGVNDARIVFYDEYGSEIKNVPISDVGNGQLNISSMNLASGLYTYSLIVNNKIVDTKKMIRTKK